MVGGGAGVTVLITLLNDQRVLATLRSLVDQQPSLAEVLVADGGSRPRLLEEVRASLASLGLPGRVVGLPGSVARTRNRALPLVEGEIVAFIDADEAAPLGWLPTLTSPILRGDADFTGGPTKPHGEPRSSYERYLNAFDAWLYAAMVARDITFLPMGNSAWRTSLLRAIGGVDERLHLGGEDYDVTLRAVAAGYRGLYVPEAWVYHDQSHLDSLGKLIRRRYRYSVGAVMAYRKNRVLRSKSLPAAISFSDFRHPLEYLDILIKPLALVHGTIAWSRRGN